MAQENKENYIFISYPHKDSELVQPIIQAMTQAGFHIWYDSGIEVGSEWPEYIEGRITNARVVLAVMSPRAIESRNCRNEINFSLELDKEILVVYLEKTVLLKGMRLQLNSTQSLYRENFADEESFLREILNARILQCCRMDAASLCDGTEEPGVQPAEAEASAEPRAAWWAFRVPQDQDLL